MQPISHLARWVTERDGNREIDPDLKLMVFRCHEIADTRKLRAAAWLELVFVGIQQREKETQMEGKFLVWIESRWGNRHYVKDAANPQGYSQCEGCWEGRKAAAEAWQSPPRMWCSPQTLEFSGGESIEWPSLVWQLPWAWAGGWAAHLQRSLPTWVFLSTHKCLQFDIEIRQLMKLPWQQTGFMLAVAASCKERALREMFTKPNVINRTRLIWAWLSTWRKN